MHAGLLQKFELYFASIFVRKSTETVGCLLHELCLENGRYCKGKLMFAFKLFAEVWAIFFKDFSWEIKRNFWLSFAWIIPGKSTMLQRQINICIQVFCRSLSYILQGFWLGYKQKHLPVFCMNYTCKIDHIAEANYCSHSSFLQKFELYYARILVRKQAETFACLLNELYLENGPFCKGKLMFANGFFAEV